MEISFPIIPHKLIWVSSQNIPRGNVINSETMFQYEPIYSDFGPIDLGQTFAFCKTVESMLREEGEVIQYCSTNAYSRSNAAYLMGAFQIIVLRKNPEQAWRPFHQLPITFITFRDASPGACSYKCTILHCLYAIYKAIQLEWFSYDSFDVSSYNNYSQMENGDINWIIPGKLIAFSSPSLQPRDNEGYRTFTPEDYVPHFLSFGVKTVIKLDGTDYDPSRFKRNRIEHIDLSFRHMNLPPQNVYLAFIEAVEERNDAIAVHCKSGLGKTGMMIGLYAMKHYDISAQEFIAWCRICRPGSIIGPQQDFLIDMETKCKNMKKKQDLLSVNTPKYNERRRFSTTSPAKVKGYTFSSLAVSTVNTPYHKKNSTSSTPAKWGNSLSPSPAPFRGSLTPMPPSPSPFSLSGYYAPYLNKIKTNYNIV